MSLINDALKRAGRKPSSEPTPEDLAGAMRPTDAASPRPLPKVFLPFALVLFCAAVWILFKGIETQTALRLPDSPAVVAARGTAPQTPPPEIVAAVVKEHPEFRLLAEQMLRGETARAHPIGPTQFVYPEAPALPATPPAASAHSAAAATPPSDASAPATTAVAPAPKVASTATAIAPAPAVVPAATPTFKLGGIIYRPASPAAVINNKTVFVGDRISKARVKSITRSTVMLELPNGQPLELTLE